MKNRMPGDGIHHVFEIGRHQEKYYSGFYEHLSLVEA
jgi:hypothetical protein